ncbi:MAG: hypothetical protein ACLQVI_00915 [Polyangiaceae bacterium]
MPEIGGFAIGLLSGATLTVLLGPMIKNRLSSKPGIVIQEQRGDATTDHVGRDSAIGSASPVHVSARVIASESSNKALLSSSSASSAREAFLTQ